MTGRVAKDIFRGLAMMHSVGVAHLDLTPGNVLLCWTVTGLVAKISDFGSAIWFGVEFGGPGPSQAAVANHKSCPAPSAPAQHASSILTAALGKPRGKPFIAKTQKECQVTWTHRAPEISLGLPYDLPADIWNAGVIIREMATGRTSFAMGTREPLNYLEYAMWHSGIINNASWPGVETAPMYIPPKRDFKADSWEESRFATPRSNSMFLPVARACLAANPNRRPLAQQAVELGPNRGLLGRYSIDWPFQGDQCLHLVPFQ